MRVIVPDVNVLMRPMYQQPHFEKAEELLRDAAYERIHLIVPQLFWSEIATALNSIPNMTRDEFEQKHVQLNKLARDGILHTARRTMTVTMRAYDISQLPKLPSAKRVTFLDAHYHALALEHEGEFVTADKKYIDAVNGRIPGATKLEDVRL